jgi:hypothetical protein
MAKLMKRLKIAVMVILSTRRGDITIETFVCDCISILNTARHYSINDILMKDACSTY